MRCIDFFSEILVRDIVRDSVRDIVRDSFRNSIVAVLVSVGCTVIRKVDVRFPLVQYLD